MHRVFILTPTRPPRLARTRLPRKARAGMDFDELSRVVAGVGREDAKLFYISKGGL